MSWLESLKLETITIHNTITFKKTVKHSVSGFQQLPRVTFTSVDTAITPPPTQHLTATSPEFGVVAANGDRLWHVEGVFQDKLHVLGGAQAGEEQVLRGDGLAQHIGDTFCLAAFGKVADLMEISGWAGLLRQILTTKSNVKHQRSLENSTFSCTWL